MSQAKHIPLPRYGLSPRAKMGKKKSNGDNGDGEVEPSANEPADREPPTPAPQRGFLPPLSIGDILALLTLIVLSAALLLEGYHKEFKDYSKEIIALFAVVVGFLLGRKT
jgi:hypothetical protein